MTGKPIFRAALSRATHQRLNLKNRRFEDLNANQATFVDCDFSYSVFERAYLRGARFEACRFVGCRFIDSNLRGTSFQVCDLKYATFQRTLLEPLEMLAVLPLEPNLRRDSLQNLRANAVEIGDYASQRLFVLSEVESHRDHLTRALKGSEDYYRRKYPGIIDKLRAFTSLTRLRIEDAVWGHGERPIRMLSSAAVLVMMLTLVNLWAVLPRVGWEATNSGAEVLRYSLDMLLDTNLKRASEDSCWSTMRWSRCDTYTSASSSRSSPSRCLIADGKAAWCLRVRVGRPGRQRRQERS